MRAVDCYRYTGCHSASRFCADRMSALSNLDENTSPDRGIDSSYDNGSSTGEIYAQYSSQMLIQPFIDLSVGSKRKSDNEVDVVSAS